MTTGDQLKQEAHLAQRGNMPRKGIVSKSARIRENET